MIYIETRLNSADSVCIINDSIELALNQHCKFEGISDALPLYDIWTRNWIRLKRRSNGVLIIRHGQSEADLLKVLEGRADFHLTEKGLIQARLLSKWIEENENIDVLLSSTLKRAKETTEIICENSNFPVIFDEELMEWDNGKLAGLTKEEADEMYPIPPNGKSLHHTIANSESLISLRARAETVLSKILEKYDDESKICVVSHGGFINMFLRALLKLSNSNELFFYSSDTGRHKIVLDKEKRYCEYLNRTDHLDYLW